MANTLRAGRITGNPATGLCERICIEVNRVFDGCRQSANGVNYVLELNGIPPQAVEPFTFNNAVSNGNSELDSVVQTPLSGNRVRLEATVTIPVLVTFTDVHGNAFTATSTLRIHQNVVLNVPERAIVPYDFKVFAIFASGIGNFISSDAVSVNGCYTLIIKVIVPVDVLVPIYGYAVYPECTDDEGNVCNILGALPLFPD